MSEAPIATPSQQQAAEPNPEAGHTAPAAQTAVTVPVSGKNLIIPVESMRVRLDEAKATGRMALQTELDKQAQALGYATHAAMIDHLRARGSQTRTPQAPRPSGGSQPAPVQAQAPLPPKNKEERKAWQKHQSDKQAWERREAQLRADLVHAKANARKAQHLRDKAEAARTLERIAVRCGVKKVGLAIYLLNEHCQGKTEDELKAFDEAKFFEGLRETEPSFFGETTIPATTGTTSSTPGSRTPPQPAGTSSAAGGAAVADVMSMTEAEFAAHQRKRGIRVVARGLG